MLRNYFSLFANVLSILITTSTIALAQNELDRSEEGAVESPPTIVISHAQLSLIENVRLSTRDPGIVEAVPVREGETISSGDTIAKLDQRLFQAEQEAAAKELAIAKQETNNDVDLQYAKVSTEVNEKVLDRSRGAVKQFAKSVSVTELEKLELELKRAQLSGEQAERKLAINELTEQLKAAELKIATAKLEYREIKSPIDGMVVEVLKQPGEWINSGEPIARIVSLDRLRVKGLSRAETIRNLKVGDAAKFNAILDGKTVSVAATLVFVSPEIDPVEQDFVIWAEIDNTDRQLYPGIVGELEIQSRHANR